MPAKLYWVDGPWSGKLALAARPRGGDWVEGDLKDWHGAGVDTVVSLLTSDEEDEIGLKGEAREAKVQGMRFVSFPIPDLQVPNSESELTAVLDGIDRDLAAGKSVLIHCRQGIGRAGLVAVCLLVSRGSSPAAAVRKVSEARGLNVPETDEQRHWIDHYATVLASTK